MVKRETSVCACVCVRGVKEKVQKIKRGNVTPSLVPSSLFAHHFWAEKNTQTLNRTKVEYLDPCKLHVKPYLTQHIDFSHDRHPLVFPPNSCKNA